MITFNKADRMWQTVRHLRLRQIGWRLWRRIAFSSAPSSRASWIDRPAVPLRATVSRPSSLVAHRTFRFLNETRKLGRGEWAPPQASELWKYNLHYFDDLASQRSDGTRERLWHDWLVDWIAECPWPAQPGWAPYPLSLRVVNWIKADLHYRILNEPVRNSLVRQVRWLTKRMEWHLMGNHLFANAKALAFAGCYFSGPEGGYWLRRGQAVISSQLAEQVLADGGNFELSPMYHAIFVEDVLDLINLAQAWPEKWPPTLVEALKDTAQRMLGWLDVMTHPDGDIPQFNDSALGVGPRASDLELYARRLGLPASRSEKPAAGPGGVLLPDSGYCRLSAGAAVVFADVAKIGPDYLPGHGHADSLSFEWSLGDSRVIVHQGTSCYGTGEVRDRERGTAAHNTVTVDGTDSSQVWGGFRVGRRARPSEPVLRQMNSEVTLECSHDGYRMLPGSPRHRRNWRLSEGRLQISDHILGGCHSAVARFRLHPNVTIHRLDKDRIELVGTMCGPVLVVVERGETRLVETYHAPEFGMVLPTMMIEIGLIDGQSSVIFEWEEG